MPSLTVTKFTVIDGDAYIQFSDGMGKVVTAESVDAVIQSAKDILDDLMLAVLVVRADRIDPTRGAAFRLAILNHTLTVNFNQDNIAVRT